MENQIFDIGRGVKRQAGTIRFLLALMLLIGVFQVFVYRLSGLTASVDGSMPVPQPDTLLYCQAAQRIADGYPFSFSSGESASTGTTSVVYPFVLAIPCICGAHGRTLLTAGFWLNACFYLLFLVGWGIFIWHFTRDAILRIFTGMVLALAVQPVYCALSQSDVGMMMAVSAGLAAGLVLRRKSLWGFALVLLPWVRPEGMMCVLGFCGALIVRAAVDRHSVRSHEWTIGGVAVASVVGVFFLNHALTGFFQFSSISNKGYFKLMPFSSAVILTFNDLIALVRSYFCSLASGGFINLIALPLVSGCAFAFGVSRHRCPRDFVLCVLLPLILAGALSFASVATSGWQGTNFDRYLAWAQPLVLIYVTAGVLWVARRVGGWIRLAVPVSFVVFHLIAAFVATCIYHKSCRDSDRLLQFSEVVSHLLPKGASVGGASCNCAYGLGEHRFFHFTGLYSLGFQYDQRTDAAARIEKLKREQAFRPDYLVMDSSDSYFGLSSENANKIGHQVLTGPDGWELRKADWSLFDAALLSELSPTGMVLVSRVDVGYEPDERQSNLEIADCWNRRLGAPFIRIGRLRGVEVIDCGRVVSGSVSMTVPLIPGRDAVVIVRSCYKETARFYDGLDAKGTEFQLDEHLGFDIEVNGAPAFHQHVDVHKPDALDADGFIEFQLVIPGGKISSEICRVKINGDHIACGYRFYQ